MGTEPKIWPQPGHLWEAFQGWLQDLITSPVMGVGVHETWILRMIMYPVCSFGKFPN